MFIAADEISQFFVTAVIFESVQFKHHHHKFNNKLIMFGNNKAPGSLFGNANTSTPTTSTPANNGVLNGKPNTGTLFSANTLSTPSPGNPTGFGNAQNNNNKPGLNLFGNNNASQNTPQTNSLFQPNNAAASTPNTSLFSGPGSNAQQNNGAGKLFGNSGGQQTATGISFGNNPSATTNNTFQSNGLNTQQSGGLFGNKSNNGGSLFGNTPSQTNSLFSNNTTNTASTVPKTSLFGNSSTQGSGSLFSSSKPTTNSTGLFNVSQLQQPQQPGQPPTNNPYGLQLSPNPVLSMPESITTSLSNERKPVSDSKQNRKFSTASSVISNNILPPTGNSTLIGKLTSRLKNLKSRETTHGLFSPSNKNLAQQDTFSALSRDESKEKGKNINNKTNSLASYFNQDVSSMKKLTIDTDRSAAKKMKLFNGHSSATIMKDMDEKDHKISISRNDKLLFSAHPSETSPTEPTSEVCLDEEHKITNKATDYWCSPTIEQLEQLTENQLTVVPNFVIGRKNFGSISFDYEVDLTAFMDDFEELFGRTIIFNENRTVEVYPDTENKPDVGYGVNVPATITLENVYPIDKKTKEPIKDNSKIAEVQYFVKRLRNMKEMEFISYNPFGGIWTFRVKHFSVWGMVNEEDMEVDAEEAERINAEEIRDRPLAFPKRRHSVKKSSTSLEAEVPSNADLTAAEALAMEKEVLDLVPVLSDSVDQDMSLIIKEKPYEPSDLDEDDLNILEAAPKLVTSSNWLQQLQLAGTSKQSVYSKPLLLKNTQGNSLDDILFPSFKKDLLTYQSVKRERRINSHMWFAKFNINGQLLLKDPSQLSGCKQIVFQSNLPINKSSFDNVFASYLNTSIVNSRPNGYPLVGKCSLQFDNLASAYSDVPNEDKILKLASILFDPLSLPYAVNSPEVEKVLIKKQRHAKLCGWIVDETRAEIDSMLSTASDIQKILLFLSVNDIVNASKTAIISKNKHLSVLITLLGSNDPIVREIAQLQLTKWKSLGSIVDPTVISIYQLLTGNPFASTALVNESNKFSRLVNLGLQVYYGDIDSLTLEDLIMNAISNPFVDTSSVSTFENLSMNIMKLFACPTIPVEQLLDELRSHSEIFDVRLCWFFTHMLQREDITEHLRDRITLEFIDQLKLDRMHKEALFVACFIADDAIAKNTIDLLLSSEILYFTSNDIKPILERLQISAPIIHRHLALYEKYSGDHLSEVSNLLKAGDFKEAELVTITTVGPKLIINAKWNNDYLSVLETLLQRFPSHTIPTWEKGLGVYEKYIKLSLHNSLDPNIIHQLINTLPNLCKDYSHHELVNVASSRISEAVSELFLINLNMLSRKIPKESLLSLPLGQPESNYLKKVLSSL